MLFLKITGLLTIRLVVTSIPAETMVMYAAEGKKAIRLSVCDPNLNIAEKTYTTKEPSRPVRKIIEPERPLEFLETPANVRLEYKGLIRYWM